MIKDYQVFGKRIRPGFYKFFVWETIILIPSIILEEPEWDDRPYLIPDLTR